MKNLNDSYFDSNAAILHRELHKKFYNHLSELLNNAEALVIVSKDNDIITGFAIGTIITCRVPDFISKVKKVGYIDEVHVIPAYRRQGLLKRMEYELLYFFKENNVEYVELSYFNSNYEAKKSWESLGYKPYMEYLRKPI